MMENVGKWCKMLKKWWKMLEMSINVRKLWKMLENDEKYWKWWKISEIVGNVRNFKNFQNYKNFKIFQNVKISRPFHGSSFLYMFYKKHEIKKHEAKIFQNNPIWHQKAMLALSS